MMGILTMNSDPLKYDKLKDNRVSAYDTYDPLSKEAGKRVQTFDKSLGYAVHPEDQASDYARRDAVVGQAQKQKGIIDSYSSNFNTNLAGADKETAGMLGSARGALSNVQRPTADLVPVRVVNGDTIEGTYMLPRAAAEQMAKESFNGEAGKFTSTWVEDNAFLNVDVNVAGIDKPYGKELHESLALAAEQTQSALNVANSEFDGEIGAANKLIDGAEETAASQRGISVADYNQTLGQANTNLGAIQEQWTGYQQQMQQTYQQGLKDTASGIYALVKSGALVFKGSIKGSK